VCVRVCVCVCVCVRERERERESELLSHDSKSPNTLGDKPVDAVLA
jgi:hypothetical protein